MPNETHEEYMEFIQISKKLKNALTIICFLGITACIILLLPPYQKKLISFFGDKASNILSLPFAALVILIFAFICLHSKEISLFIESGTRPLFIIIISFLILLFIFIGIFSYRYGWQWLDSDQSSEMVLAKLLSEENVLVTTKWLYAAEIHLIYQTIFTMPLFKILGSFGNWALIRSLGIVLNNLLLLFSYFFMMKHLKINIKWILLSCIFLFIPLTYNYWDIVSFGGNYIFFLAQFFICFGFFIRLNSNNTMANKVSKDFILFLAFSFILGVEGIRPLMAFSIPLLMVSLYFKNRRLIISGLFGFLASCGGYAINTILHIWYKFESFSDLRIENFNSYFTKLGECLMNIAGFFGLSSGTSLISAQGFFGMAAIIGTFLMIYSLIKIIKKKETLECSGEEYQQKIKKRIIPVFFIMSAIINIFTFVIINAPITNRFFIPFMVFYVPLAGILFEHAEKNYAFLKRTAIIFGIIIFIFGQGFLSFQGFFTKDINTGRKAYMAFLFEEQLEYGFATHWNANVTTELTNGKIELVNILPERGRSGENKFRLSDILIPVKYYNPAYYNGKSFLLLTREEWNFIRRSYPFSGEMPDYEDGSFIIVIFPSAEIIYRDILF
ncbi:MAG: hypothetical protein FWH35_01155 [Treponema sp.]|nr:hypothetical protein [Treponema sp.]